MKIFRYMLAVCCILSLAACKKSLMDDVDNDSWNKERNVLGIKFEGQVGKATITRNGDETLISFTYNVAEGDINSVKIKNMEISYDASSSVKEGDSLDFDNETKSTTITITPKHGEPLVWHIKLNEFEEILLGTWNITGLYVYGGTGPAYGGAAILKMSDKPWCWSATDGPSVEEDNTITFQLKGIDDSGNTFGTFDHAPGKDGKYTDFKFVDDTEIDVNHFYRKIPKGTGNWYRNYAKGTLQIEFPDGSIEKCTLLNQSSVDVGNGTVRNLNSPSLMFSLQGADNWDKIYSDYDRFVANPRKFWIDISKQ